MCLKVKLESDFGTYFHSSQGKFRIRHQCKECCYNRAKLYKKEKRAELKSKKINTSNLDKLKFYLENNKDWRYTKKPGTYTNPEQKEMMQIFMKEILHWNYNSDKNLFYKDGVRDIDGKFINIKKKNVTIDKAGKKFYSEEVKNEMVPKIYQMRESKIPWKIIEHELDIKLSTLTKWYNEYRK